MTTMDRSPRAASLLLAALLVLGTLSPGVADEEGPERNFAKLEHGMTPDQVRDCVGSPKRISRQILYHRYLEQWIYDSPAAPRLTFDCLRGQKPQLIWKKKLTESRP
jgi:hypothetical protein